MLSYSIVIPTKNEEKNLARLLKSIRSQKYQPEEIIVSDDSTDNTRKVAKSYGARIVQGVSNGLIGLGRNLGAETVKSEYILFLDADNELPKNFLKNFFAEFIRRKADVATPYLKSFSEKKLDKLFFYSWNKARDISSKTPALFLESGACILVKRDYFKKVNGFSKKLRIGEDFDFIRKVRFAGGKHIVIPISIKTSDRRFKDRSPKSMALLGIGLIGLVLTVVLGVKFLKKKQRKIEKMYGDTGG
jgi:glycosyltransferase involved in cell wall biosynthesis